MTLHAAGLTYNDLVAHGDAAVKVATDYDPEETGRMSPEDRREERQTYLRDAITSLHHWADYHGLDWEHGLDELHYDAERRYADRPDEPIPA